MSPAAAKRSSSREMRKWLSSDSKEDYFVNLEDLF